jgi:hypothetical protein
MNYFKIQHFVLATKFLIEIDRAELRAEMKFFKFMEFLDACIRSSEETFFTKDVRLKMYVEAYWYPEMLIVSRMNTLTH